MKIKTITCHDVYNAGASLQAYALVTYLNKLGHEARIIDYKPEYLSRHYRLWGGASGKYNKPLLRELYSLIKFPRRLKLKLGKRKKEYDNFTQKHLILTDKRYNSYEELLDNPPQADVYFAGSDQIWNTLFENGRDPSFYLQFAPENAVRASYAASFATDSIADEYKISVSKWLKELDFISVREESGVDIVEDMGIYNVVQVLDPVFLLSKEDWLNVLKPIDINEPYLLIYDFDINDKLAEFAKKLAKDMNLKIYSVLDNPNCDRSFSQVGPDGFVTLVKNAEYVISNSFHATAFSIIFEKQFFVFDRFENINKRMHDLLKAFKLESRLVLDDFDSSEINYNEIRNNINKQIGYSQKYIDKVLECANND